VTKKTEPIRFAGSQLGENRHVCAFFNSDEEAYRVLLPLAELAGDNKQLVGYLRATHAACDEYNDVATASLLENWIDEAERRVWFLYESTRSAHADSL
jgi:DNA-binding ferritin-like protein